MHTIISAEEEERKEKRGEVASHQDAHPPEPKLLGPFHLSTLLSVIIGSGV